MLGDEDISRMRSALSDQLSRNDSSNHVVISPHTSAEFLTDPCYWLWRLSRYKHTSRLLAGKQDVLEIGSGDGFGSPLVASCVGHLTSLELLPELFEHATTFVQPLFSNLQFIQSRFPIPPSHPSASRSFDAIFCLDVFEHIQPDDSEEFTKAVVSSLKPGGCYLVGIPSLESQEHASEGSKLGHVNCLTRDQLRSHLKQHFHNVFILGINDESLHTGFSAMTHYHIAVCADAIK